MAILLHMNLAKLYQMVRTKLLQQHHSVVTSHHCHKLLSHSSNFSRHNSILLSRPRASTSSQWCGLTFLQWQATIIDHWDDGGREATVVIVRSWNSNMVRSYYNWFRHERVQALSDCAFMLNWAKLNLAQAFGVEIGVEIGPDRFSILQLSASTWSRHFQRKSIAQRCWR